MLDRVKQFWRRSGDDRKPATDGLALKRAYEKQRVGVTALDPFPQANTRKLFQWSRESDLAYACISKIVEAAQDPDLIIQQRKDRKAEWETLYGHPLRRLLMMPNPGYGMGPTTQAEFLGSWLASEQICGTFFAEIERAKRTGKPVALWPLDPTCMTVNNDTGRWEWRHGSERVEFEERDLFISHLPDAQRPWKSLAPLSVALGAVEADAMQNGFVRAFFKNGGVPSGIIKIKGVLQGEAGKQRAREIKENWIRNRGFLGKFFVAPEVFDDNASYQKTGSNLDELDGGSLRSQNEARICGVFGVPPLLVSAYVGLRFVNQRASAIEGQKDFWANKMSPTFKRLRTKLQWSLLREFEDDEDIFDESVRVFWDMSHVVALQEDISQRDLRARESFRAGALRLDQYKAIMGLPIEPGDNYYLRRANLIPISQEVVAAQMEAAAVAAARAMSLVIAGASSVPLAESETDGSKQ